MEPFIPKIQNYKDLIVWQLAHQLTIAIYQLTYSFPKEELYGLTSQIRRAAASTAANITEGSKRRSTNDLCHFLNMSEASNEQVKYFLLLAKDLTYLSVDSFRTNYQLADRVSAMLHKLITSLNS